jgi:PEGA domain
VRRRTSGVVAFCICSLLVQALSAKEQPAQIIVWPTTGKPVLRFSLGKFKETSSAGKQHNYNVDVTAENLWDRKIPKAEFVLYLYDKDKTRIGDGWVSISDVAMGQTVKFQIFVQSSGTPATTELVPKVLPRELMADLPPRAISLTVNSVPQGANVKVDGVDAGVTPKIVQVTPGKHMLEFSKEGFNSGHFPLEITPDDVSGGSVSYELGASAHDTVELRDGTVLNGDVESVSATEILIKIGGTVQHFSRNQVKRIGLVPRDELPK